MSKANKEIRLKAFEAGIPHWKIAERLGMKGSNFCVMLRQELTEEKKNEILRIIDELKGEQ